MPYKALVFDSAEFRSLITDLIGEWREVRDEYDSVEEWLEAWFDDYLDVEGMDMVMANVEGYWWEIYTGENFVRLLDRIGRLEDFDEGRKGRIKRGRKRI